MRNLYLIFFLLFAICTTSMAQGRKRTKKQDRRRFKASLVLGGYGSQVDGDNFVGYNKFGLSGGVRATAVLNRHFDANIELLYQQKGSRFESRPGGSRDRILHLDYMEVPILLRYYPQKKEEGISLAAGFAFARIINTKITERPIKDKLSYDMIAGDFTSNEVSFVGDAAIKLTPNLSIGGRYSYSFSRFYDNPEGISPPASTAGGSGTTETVFFLRNYMIGGYAAYTF